MTDMVAIGPGHAAHDALLAMTLGALDAPRHPVVIGISGAQGSGKSTLARALAASLDAMAVSCTVLSLDDLYLPRADRARLARGVHPLLATRGVPGTHDVALGLAVIAALERGEPAALPRFDKARDDRLPASLWDRAPARLKVLVFEGWCLGARPQTAEVLAIPVNPLERDEDADGGWRAFANTALAGDYARLWARIDRLALLLAPDFDCVARWRGEQEQTLRAANPGAAGAGGNGIMDQTAIPRFVAHYERITRQIMADLPAHADLVLSLDSARRVRSVSGSA